MLCSQRRVLTTEGGVGALESGDEAVEQREQHLPVLWVGRRAPLDLLQVHHQGLREGGAEHTGSLGVGG